MDEVPVTYLERLRADMGLEAHSSYEPQWRFEEVERGFTWLFDGDRAIGLLDSDGETFELRCHGPGSDCAPAILAEHYHNPAYVGVRIISTWRLGGQGVGECTGRGTHAELQGDVPVISQVSSWADGSVSRTEIRVRFDAAWGAYVADVTADLRARRATTALEYCNILPAAIGDTRPGRERFPLTFWKHPGGLRKMLKNPLWFCSIGAQDYSGEKHIEQGGFLGFGPDEYMNPVVEIVRSDPETGATTCDNLQDEHIMAWPAEGRHGSSTGWFRLRADYRLFSVPPEMAREIAERAEFMRPGAMAAWKFQYPRTPQLPESLDRVALPGSPFSGESDWSVPIPWDEPYDGRLWTASPDPAAPIHFDRETGHGRPGSIRLRVNGDALGFAPGSGHTLHTEDGKTYRFSIWAKTEGAATGWIEAWEILFRRGDRDFHASAAVGPDSDWTLLETTFTAKGDDAPFADTVLQAKGTGKVWFSDMVFGVL